MPLRGLNKLRFAPDLRPLHPLRFAVSPPGWLTWVLAHPRNEPGTLPCFALDQGTGLGLSKVVALGTETHFILTYPLNPAACGGCATARMNL